MPWRDRSYPRPVDYASRSHGHFGSSTRLADGALPEDRCGVTTKEGLLTCSIIGFGAIGQALARTFARKGIEVMVASRRSPEALAPQARAIGPGVIPAPLEDALEGDIVFLAVPFARHGDLAQARSNWQGRIVVDVTNAFGVPVEDLGGLPSSAAVARGLPGARLVKGFNHLAARTLGADPDVNGGRPSCRATTRMRQRP